MILRKICACCGAITIGEQFFNQDNGYGLCEKCIPFVSRNSTRVDVERTYGKFGVNYAVPQPHKFSFLMNLLLQVRHVGFDDAILKASTEMMFYKGLTQEEIRHWLIDCNLAFSDFTAEQLFFNEIPMPLLIKLWDEFGNVPVYPEGDQVDCIEEDFMGFPQYFHREEIWRWFEAQNSQFLVGEAMNGKYKGLAA